MLKQKGALFLYLDNNYLNIIRTSFLQLQYFPFLLLWGGRKKMSTQRDGKMGKGLQLGISNGRAGRQADPKPWGYRWGREDEEEQSFFFGRKVSVKRSGKLKEIASMYSEGARSTTITYYVMILQKTTHKCRRDKNQKWLRGGHGPGWEKIFEQMAKLHNRKRHHRHRTQTNNWRAWIDKIDLSARCPAIPNFSSFLKAASWKLIRFRDHSR